MQKISIAIATYNGADYIEAQLKSILDQTYRPDEVVITDDCSSDNTVSIIENFAAKAPFEIFVSVNEKNLGYAQNFNSALMKATGDLIFLCDQDDVWLPEKIEYMIQISHDYPDYMVYMNDALLVDKLLNSSGLTKIHQINSVGLSNKEFVMGCCCLIRKEFLLFALPIPEGIKSHDLWLVNLAEGINKKLVDNKVLQLYRRHENNESQVEFNSLSRVSKWHRYWGGFKRSFGRNRILPEKELKNKMVYFDALQSVLLRSPSSYSNNILIMMDNIRKDCDLLEKRIDVRKSFIVIRLLKVFWMLFSCYPKDKKIKLAIRDIFG